VNDIRKVIEFYANTRHEYKLLEQLDELESKAKLADAFAWVLEHQPELIGLLYTYRGSYNLSRVPQSLIEAYEKGKEV
jgi:hypothetical protein